jgi:hypothetical protein
MRLTRTTAQLDGMSPMGVRLSFGKGPLRVSVPLTSGKLRSRRKTWHAIAKFADGSEYKCHHNHQTEQAAIACAQKYRRNRTAGKDVPPLTKKPRKSKPASAGRRPNAADRTQDELRARVRISLEDVRRSRERVEQELVLLRESVGKLGNQMQSCLEVGREDLAREASRRKIAIQMQLIDLESRRDQLSSEQAKLEAAARKLGMGA